MWSCPRQAHLRFRWPRCQSTVWVDEHAERPVESRRAQFSHKILVISSPSPLTLGDLNAWRQSAGRQNMLRRRNTGTVPRHQDGCYSSSWLHSKKELSDIRQKLVLHLLIALPSKYGSVIINNLIDTAPLHLCVSRTLFHVQIFNLRAVVESESRTKSHVKFEQYTMTSSCSFLVFSVEFLDKMVDHIRLPNPSPSRWVSLVFDGQKRDIKNATTKGQGWGHSSSQHNRPSRQNDQR